MMPVKKRKKSPANPAAPYGTCADGTPRAKPGPEPMPLADRLLMRSFRSLDSEWELWLSAARSNEMTRTDWIRHVCNEAAAELIKKAKKTR